jgi:hypothetical protein
MAETTVVFHKAYQPALLEPTLAHAYDSLS